MAIRDKDIHNFFEREQRINHLVHRSDELDQAAEQFYGRSRMANRLAEQSSSRFAATATCYGFMIMILLVVAVFGMVVHMTPEVKDDVTKILNMVAITERGRNLDENVGIEQ